MIVIYERINFKKEEKEKEMSRHLISNTGIYKYLTVIAWQKKFK